MVVLVYPSIPAYFLNPTIEFRQMLILNKSNNLCHFKKKTIVSDRWQVNENI